MSGPETGKGVISICFAFGGENNCVVDFYVGKKTYVHMQPIKKIWWNVIYII